MMFRLVDDNDNETKNHEEKKEYAFPSPGILLVPGIPIITLEV